MDEISASRRDIIQAFKEYRIISDRWNFVNDKTMIYFDRHCLNLFPNDAGITQAMVDTWCLQRETESVTSCYCRSQIIAALVVFLNNRKITELKEPELVKPDRSRKYVPHAFSQEELAAFFHECDIHVRKATDPIQAAHRLSASVYFRLIYSSGMRTIEARLLKVENVDLDHGVIDVEKSKGVDQHYVALHASMTEILKQYDNTMEKIFPGRRYFFSYSASDPFYREWSSLMFRYRWDKVNNAHTHPYDLRHNYAVQNINSWTDKGFGFTDRFVYLSKSMGHKRLDSTSYYYSLVPALADSLALHSQKGFDDIIPEVKPDEKA